MKNSALTKPANLLASAVSLIRQAKRTLPCEASVSITAGIDEILNYAGHVEQRMREDGLWQSGVQSLPIGKGSKTRQWDNKRATLKTKFFRRGIIYCELNYEGCYRDNFLGFAHARKRHYLKDGELGDVILACNHCHDVLERMTPEAMFEAVYTIIQNRETPVV